MYYVEEICDWEDGGIYEVRKLKIKLKENFILSKCGPGIGRKIPSISRAHYVWFILKQTIEILELCGVPMFDRKCGSFEEDKEFCDKENEENKENKIVSHIAVPNSCLSPLIDLIILIVVRVL